eukprot:TRINITY_DN3394_c0_g3_i2.p1 TRINITY_DN3394_c0_g3~~TRINITY_DN3394_c0_g3_i2.p1  ORF type:complete len:2032 (-),score=553.90 TRINITY_DN3394_c0_g3_i2:810-6557(-)
MAPSIQHSEILQRLEQVTQHSMVNDSIRLRVLQGLQMVRYSDRDGWNCIDVCKRILKDRMYKCRSRLTRVHLSTCVSSILQTMSADEALMELFLGFLFDKDFPVRQRMASAVTVLFDGSVVVDAIQDGGAPITTLEERVAQVTTGLANFAQHFLVDQPEKARTVYLTYGEIAASSVAHERAMLYALCQRSTTELQQFASAVIAKLAKALDYSSSAQLLDQHMLYIMGRWLSSGNSLHEFPSSLTGAPNFSEFLKAHERAIVPYMIVLDEGNQAGVQELAGMMNCTPFDLISRNFASIFALTYPLYFNAERRDAADAVVRQCMQDVLSVKTFDELLASSMDQVICELLDRLVHEGETEPQPFEYPHTTTAEVFTHVGGKSMPTLEAIMTNRKFPDRLQRVLLHLQERLAVPRAYNRERSWRVVEFFLDFLTEASLKTMPVFRDVIHLLLRALTDVPSMRSRVCSHLQRVCQSVMHVPQVLPRQLRLIITSLVPHAADPAVMQMLSFLMITSRNTLRAELQQLDPFPTHPMFEELTRAYLDIRGECGLVEEMRRFTEHARSNASAVALSAALSHLHTQLREKHDDLARFLKTSQSHEETAKLVRLLVKLGSEQRIEEVRERVGQCLGELAGAVDPFVIAQAFASPSADSAQLPMVRLLCTLSQLLVHADVRVVRAAAAALSTVLRTEQGASAYKHSPDDVQQYLSPFKSTRSEALKTAPVANANLEEAFSVRGKPYAEWVCNCTFALITTCIEDPVLCACAPVCQLNFSFAELLFPMAIQFVINTENAQYLSKLLQEQVLQHAEAAPEAMRLLLSALNFLRLESMRPATKAQRESSQHDYVVDLDYLHVASAAKRAGSYVSALFQLERWFEQKHERVLIKADEITADQRTMLIDIFKHVDEPDSIYGVSSGPEIADRIQTYEHEGNWAKALESYDVLLQQQQSDVEKHLGMLRCLQQLGHSHLLDFYLREFVAKFPQHVSQVAELQYEEAWRSCRWQLDSSLQLALGDAPERGGFHVALHSTLRALAEGSGATFDICKNRLRLQLVADAASAGSESTQQVYPSLLRLQMLSEAEDAMRLRAVMNSREMRLEERLHELLEQWKFRIHEADNFRFVEPLLTLRFALLPTIGRSDCLVSVPLVSAARKAGHFAVAKRALLQLKRLEFDPDADQMWPLEEAKILWAEGDGAAAVKAARALVASDMCIRSETLKAETLCVLGKWMAVLRSDRAADVTRVMSDAVEAAGAAHKKMDVDGVDSNLSKAYFRLADFSTQLYYDLDSRIKSKDWQQLQSVHEHKREQLKAVEEQIRKADEKTKKYLQYIRQQTVKQIEISEQDHVRAEADVGEHVHVAVQNYIQCLAAGNKYDTRAVFSLVSLWFNNLSVEKVNKTVSTSLQHVPSHKFIVLMYQLASRLGKNTTTLSDLLFRMAAQHPHHVLWHLFALMNGNNVPPESKREQFKFDKDKIDAAAQIITKLQSKAAPLHVKSIVVETHALSKAYIELAYRDMKAFKTFPEIKFGQLTTKPLIAGIAKLTNLPVPTRELAIRPDGNYKDLVTVERFNDRIQFHGGINLPRTLELLGSDGKTYVHLCKGKDDMRQDAVMEQMFGMVNELLVHDPATRYRHLRIRTYKIVPLSPVAGLVEWVQDTVPLGTYLIGRGSSANKSAHARFRPQDWKMDKCRTEMTAVAESIDSEKRKRLDTVFAHFKPVFHHFFLEKFSEPAEWFQKRLQYTRSVAVSSIVDFVVGLGDRHSMNILLDESTAEVVHIDLGVAFDQGKLLPTPELVPFRLTRDIVDGMGITGTEGVFRRCCEHTLRVLRANQQALITVVEVLMHDPLYRWALSPLQAVRVQRRGDDSLGDVEDLEGGGVNRDAQQTLLMLKKKLQGNEGGEVLSVEGHVNKLIAEAQSLDNMSKMFAGWGAWI